MAEYKNPEAADIQGVAKQMKLTDSQKQRLLAEVFAGKDIPYKQPDAIHKEIMGTSASREAGNSQAAVDMIQEYGDKELSDYAKEQLRLLRNREFNRRLSQEKLLNKFGFGAKQY